jgi:precorrin-6A/cobalt-precorrin-6A reductase
LAVPVNRILILGGTGEARLLAGKLTDAGRDVITSLAGVTRSPHLPKGEVRHGGFGGSAALAAYLRKGHVTTLVDATHPFAVRISTHAAEAAKMCALTLYRLERPVWIAGSGDQWISVSDIASAVNALPSGARVFLTIGRKGVAPFLQRGDLEGVLRMIEAPESPPPATWHLILARPPFTVAEETDLLLRHRITHLVCKNSGGEQTSAKLTAARSTKIPVVMIERAPKPEAVVLTSLDEAVGVLSP